MVPDFRRDAVWTPTFVGVTIQETFYEIIKFGIPLADDFILLYPISLAKDGISSSPCAESLEINWVETSFNPWLGPAP